MAFEWPVSLVTPLLAAAVALSVIFMALVPSLNGYGPGNIFAYHAVFMAVGFLALLPLAQLAYVAHLGHGNRAYPDRASRRVLHGVLGFLGGIFILLGYAVAFVYHQAKGQAHYAWNNPQYSADPDTYSLKARAAHAVIGSIVVLCVLVQMAGGLAKWVAATRGFKVLAVHGKVGPLIWSLGLVCFMLAAYFEYEEKRYKTGTWSLGEAAVIWVGVGALFVAVALHRHLGSTKHIAEPLVDDEGDEYTRRLSRGSQSGRLLASVQ